MKYCNCGVQFIPGEKVCVACGALTPAAQRHIERVNKKVEQELKRAEKKQKSEEIRRTRDAEKLAKANAPKVEKSEAELVRDYANRVIKNSMYHGRVDTTKFQGLEHTHSVSKNLWMDQDFFFSVVFQSGEQKREFLRKFLAAHPGASDPDETFSIQILNGLDLAKLLGIELKEETTRDYPTASIDMLPFVLDNESLQGGQHGQE